MNHRLKQIIVSAIALLAFSPAIAACSSGDNHKAAQPDQTCIQQMDPAQQAQLQSYVQQHGDEAQAVVNNGDGTSEICILQSNGEMHYYNQQDHFSQYLMYAMLMGNGRQLANYGLLTGQLDFSQYLALQLLTGISSNGSVYHPYTHTSSGWGRHTTVIQHVHVTQVQYGSRPATRFSSTSFSTAPRGYSTTATRLPRSSGSTASLTRNPNGTSIVRPVPRTNAPAYRNPSRPSTRPSNNTSNNRPAVRPTTRSRCCQSTSRPRPRHT